VNLRTLLLTKNELRKLLIEFWKYILVAILGTIALLIPTIRQWFTGFLAYFATHQIALPGLLFLALTVAALFAFFVLCRSAVVQVWRPHTRRYTAAHFDGIDWTWRWRKGRVAERTWWNGHGGILHAL
jgi:hypothetical protein